MEYLIQGETLAGIADEVRRLSGTEEAMAPDEMKAALAAVQAGVSSDLINGIIGGTITEVKSEIFEGVTTIREYMFYNQASIQTVEIPDNVTQIKEYAFYNVLNIKNLKIPYTISMNYNSFSYCSKIENLIFSQGIGSAEYDATSIKNTPWYISRNSIKNVTLCEGMTKLGNQLLREMPLLETIVIPKTVTELGVSTFYNSGLKNIFIPKSVIKIERYCFYGNSNLTDVYYEGTEEDWSKIEIGENNVYITNNVATIHYNTPM